MTLFEPANLRIFDAALVRHRAQITGEPASDCEALADILSTAMQWAHERRLPWTSILRTANCDFEAALRDRRQKSLPYRLRVPAAATGEYELWASANPPVWGSHGRAPSGEQQGYPFGERAE